MGLKIQRSQQSAGRGRAAKGFTLVEVLIVVAIIGLLAAVAMPSYQSYVQKSRRSDAKSALMDAANRQQQFLLNRGTYTTNMRDLGYAADPANSPDNFYQIDAAACGAGVPAHALLSADGHPRRLPGRRRWLHHFHPDVGRGARRNGHHAEPVLVKHGETP